MAWSSTPVKASMLGFCRGRGCEAELARLVADALRVVMTETREQKTQENKKRAALEASAAAKRGVGGGGRRGGGGEGDEGGDPVGAGVGGGGKGGRNEGEAKHDRAHTGGERRARPRLRSSSSRNQRATRAVYCKRCQRGVAASRRGLHPRKLAHVLAASAAAALAAVHAHGGPVGVVAQARGEALLRRGGGGARARRRRDVVQQLRHELQLEHAPRAAAFAVGHGGALVGRAAPQRAAAALVADHLVARARHHLAEALVPRPRPRPGTCLLVASRGAACSARRRRLRRRCRRRNRSRRRRRRRRPGPTAALLDARRSQSPPR
ncbi:programmed cell death protein [Gracilaria domingensis]|nr:programmed cell death protein [Gracilaria domingensis]